MPSTAAPGAAAIPLGPIASQPVAPAVGGNNTAASNAASSTPPNIAQNNTTASPSKRQSRFATIWLPNLFQGVAICIAIAFGGLGIWYMHRTDTVQVWTTKKDEWEYCDSQKDAAILPPHCPKVLATPLEPRPYTLAKRDLMSLSTKHAGLSRLDGISLGVAIFSAVFSLMMAIPAYIASKRAGQNRYRGLHSY